MKLDLGGISLPLDAVTQTFGVLAVRGAGKSNLAAVMAEQMHAARLPFVVVDPVGAWWGLRSSSDGAGPGIPVPIFGGRHGDVPLEETGGQVIADLVVDERASCILDISELSEGAKTRFLIDFAERLYRRNTEPLHLFLEEADDFIPQRPFREQARMLRAWENVVRRGRARGLGMTMLTQRSASINKSVLTQVETLFVLRTTSPQDRKAIEGWVDYHGQSREIVASLPELAAGEAWVWSPQWLKVMKRVQIARRATFDSGATPESMKTSRPAATLAEVDLGRVRDKMTATIERAKADDPRELRKRIAQLERELAATRAAVPETKVERHDVPVLSPESLEEIRYLKRSADALLNRVEIVASMAALTTPRAAPPPSRPPAPVVQRRTPPSTNGQAQPMAGGERKVLTVLAQYPAGRTAVQVAVLTGYASTGGGFNNYLGSLRGRGWIEGGRDRIVATEAGLAALGAWQPLPSGDALREHWLGQITKAERAALSALIEAYPRALTKDEVARRAGYEANGGGFNNALSRLRTLELIEGRGELRASEDLFG